MDDVKRWELLLRISHNEDFYLNLPTTHKGVAKTIFKDAASFKVAIKDKTGDLVRALDIAIQKGDGEYFHTLADAIIAHGATQDYGFKPHSDFAKAIRGDGNPISFATAIDPYLKTLPKAQGYDRVRFLILSDYFNPDGTQKLHFTSSQMIKDLKRAFGDAFTIDVNQLRRMCKSMGYKFGKVGRPKGVNK